MERPHFCGKTWEKLEIGVFLPEKLGNYALGPVHFVNIGV
jgi:hypothetical protein